MATRSPAQASSSKRGVASNSEAERPLVVGDFLRGGQIGKGSFAVVYSARHSSKKSLAAIKSVDTQKLTKKLRDNLQSEIEILKSLQHPHIVAIFACHHAPDRMHIIMEYCSMGDLSQFIKGRSTLTNHPVMGDALRRYPNIQGAGLNEVIVRHFLKQIASAVQFLHARNIIHRDIKPQNILLNPSPLSLRTQKPEEKPLEASANSLVPMVGVESLPMLKIADFGFARFLPQTSLAETLCGSPLYMAPEILRYEKYDAKADLWSVGTVTFELLVGKPPFRASNHVELLRKIEKAEDVVPFPPGFHVGSSLKKAIRGLLKKSPVERISFEDFFDHPVILEEIPGLLGEDKPRELTKLSGELDRTTDRRTSKTQESVPQTARRHERVLSEAKAIEKVVRDSAEDSGPTFSNTRPSPVTATTAPGRPSSAGRRNTGSSPTTLPTLQEKRLQEQGHEQPRRPGIVPHATAPAREHIVQDRGPAAAAIAIERRNSRKNSPSSSILKDQLDRERGALNRRDDRAAKEARERAAQDVAFERDYVLVEKRAVEVNAFADELAASPYAGNQLPNQGPVVRRTTLQGTPASLPTNAANHGRGIPGTSRQDIIHQRRPSYERRYGSSAGSATSVLSKAINAASLRILGTGYSPPLGKGLSPPQGYNAFPTYPTAQGHQLLIGDGRKAPLDRDAEVVLTIEDAATRSDTVYGFAEVKYKQLLPAAPSNEQGLGIHRPGTGDDAVPEEDDLTVDAIVAISEEALVLYVKALSILAKAIDLAGTWWGQRNRGEITSESPTSRTELVRTGQTNVHTRMNNVVQWARTRFNECVEKSEFVGRKLVEAQKQLPFDHPGHPSNHPAASNSATSIGTSAENITLTSGVTAEKLMYDRALEMSRQAAVNELVGEDLPGCELTYMTALRMLEAVLESDDEPLRSSSSAKKNTKAEDEIITGMETEDRQTVMKLIEGTKSRLNALRKKIAVQNSNKRASLTGAPPSRNSSKTSPAPSPTMANTPPR
ncbi:MAG: Serine/threonine-protein kinase [Bogoriella megaspora]|nr:MAG: Serine/threonine-protein kinase [Bogoriella megaspora]